MSRSCNLKEKGGFVLGKQVGWEPEGKGNGKLMHSIEIYGNICDWYGAFLKTGEAREAIGVFDKCLPRYKDAISRTKKIDFLIWMGQGET